MSIAKEHNEWLSLIDISGPFLSLKVLTDLFPQGLPVVATELRSDLRAAYNEWADNQRGLQQDEAMHQAWFEFIFTDLLGYKPNLFVPCSADGCPAEWQTTLAERQITLRPDFVLRHPDEALPRLLVMTLPSSQGLEKRSKEAYMAANEMSPATQMLELLRGTGVPLGLVSNGAEWLLVYSVPGEAASYATWKAELWLDEPVTLNAFYTLLHLSRFFGVPDDELLPALLAASKDNQHDVTDQLGIQVRHAVEILVQAIAQADMDQQGKLLAGLTEQTIYEAAVTVMMRLVFLLSAEEQGLLLLGDPIYDQNYAVSTLRAQLREAADQVGEEVIQRRTDAWARLLATFRAVHSGIWHPQLGLPAYGGSLFDPDRFPFLEGRTGEEAADVPVTPLQIDNRTVLHLLQALQQLELRAGGVTTLRTLSFRALDVEQIGHVYEGLLDHQAVRAKEVVLGLEGAAGLEPEIPLATLEAAAAKGQKALLDYLTGETKRSTSALKNGLGAELSDLRHSRFLTACGGDEKLFRRVLPFAGLVRDDTRDEPLVILPGEVYVTAGLTRRQTGSHYTPRSLTEPIVQHTLEPLVYVGPAEGLPREQWQLKPAAELLRLKLCDMAMGSGAFLVQMCRYMAERLLEAWQAEAVPVGAEPTADRPFAGAFAGQNLDELYTLAKRLVAERCLYGVDKNPLAVEMAKLSLWLVTLSKNKPFTFVDHALRHGDSLIGADEEAYNRWWHSLKGTVGPLYAEENEKALAEARRLRRELQAIQVLDVQDAQQKEALLKQAEKATAKIRRACDLLVGIQLLGLSKTEQEAWQQKLLIEHTSSEEMNSMEAKQALVTARQHDAFHWFMEFPEVFARGGFSAFVGNPPFLGNRLWATNIGDYLHSYAKHMIGKSSGKADLCALFFFRSFGLLASKSTAGLIATDSIRQGDSRIVGLEPIAKKGTIFRAISSRNWPGQATVKISVVWFAKQKNLKIPYILDDYKEAEINSYLKARANINPHVLHNSPQAFEGSHNGKGQALLLKTGDSWLEKLQASGSPFCRLYVTANDLNTHGFQKCDRWIVDCQDFTLEEILQQNKQTYEFLLKVVQPHRTAEALASYPGLAEKWWQLWRNKADLYRNLRTQNTCLAMPVVSKYVLVTRAPTNWVFTNKFFIVFENRQDLHLLLLSSMSDIWMREFSGPFGETVSLSITKALNTFPLPENIVSNIELSGKIEQVSYRYCKEYDTGFTQLYNRFHDPAETAQDITHLRHLHVEMDNAVAAAYGWSDLDLGHGFHQTAQGERYTISEPARREVLTRLLQLNHQRYKEEVAAGLHDKKEEITAKEQKQKRGIGKKGTEE